jgi:hypothetical protein
VLDGVRVLHGVPVSAPRQELRLPRRPSGQHVLVINDLCRVRMSPSLSVSAVRCCAPLLASRRRPPRAWPASATSASLRLAPHLLQPSCACRPLVDPDPRRPRVGRSSAPSRSPSSRRRAASPRGSTS